jgi:hypothetical protein
MNHYKMRLNFKIFICKTQQTRESARAALAQEIVQEKIPLHLQFLILRPARWFNFNLSLLDVIPVSTKRGTSTLTIALHHGSFSILVSSGVDLLEERVKRRVSSSIRIFLGCFLRSSCFQRGFSQGVPVLFRGCAVIRLNWGRCRRSGSCQMGSLDGISELDVNGEVGTYRLR